MLDVQCSMNVSTHGRLAHLLYRTRRGKKTSNEAIKTEMHKEQKDNTSQTLRVKNS
jgi:hypothetical protein